MTQKLKLYTVATLAGLTLIGCGGGGSSSNVDENVSTETTKVYNVTVISDKSLPTSVCKGATGTLIINNDVVSGTVNSDWGKAYDITGTYIPENNHIEGGFADAGTQVATYEGTADQSNASGTWRDSSCYGTWTGTLK